MVHETTRQQQLQLSELLKSGSLLWFLFCCACFCPHPSAKNIKYLGKERALQWSSLPHGVCMTFKPHLSSKSCLTAAINVIYPLPLANIEIYTYLVCVGGTTRCIPSTAVTSRSLTQGLLPFQPDHRRQAPGRGGGWGGVHER